MQLFVIQKSCIYKSGEDMTYVLNVNVKNDDRK